MKSTIIGDSAVTSGIDNAKSFDFKMDAHAFKLFSDGLYSNKTLAPLREYTTNAIDSLIESGNEDKGYVVHLPNRLEPFWSIRDFGTGIPDAEMPDLFTFNHSNKRDTNKLNGTFGLGSKSFLTLSETATFTTFHNGMKFVYFVFKDQGLPTYTRIEECETDEPNGVEVKIPIDAHKFNDVIETYKNFCRYVMIKPTVVGHDKQSWDSSFAQFKRDEVDLGEGCIFGGRSDYSSKGRPVLVFGNVSYRLNQYMDSFDFLHIPVMHVPIGSVDIVPSREELAMTDKTLDYIQTIAPKFRKQVATHIDEYYKEHGFIDTIKHVTSTIGKIEDFPINGKKVSTKIRVAHYAKADYYSSKKVTYTDKGQEWYGVTYETNVLLNFEDVLKRYKPRVRQYALDNSGAVVIISDPIQAQKYCEHFEVDINTLEHLKDVDPPELKRSTFDAKGYRFTGLRKLDFYANQVECEEVDLSTLDTIYYVYRKNKKLFRNYDSSEYLDEVTKSIYMVCQSTLWKEEDIYALTYRQVKQCENAGVEVINVLDHIESNIDADVLYKASKFWAFADNKYDFCGFHNNILMIDILPDDYYFVMELEDSEEYKAYHELGGKLYIDMGLGADVTGVEVATIQKILHGDVGRFLSMYNRTYSNKPSQDFIDMVLTGLGEQLTKERAEAEAKAIADAKLAEENEDK